MIPPDKAGSASVTLTPAAPYRLDLTVLALRRGAANIVDRWESPTYRRVFVLDGSPIEAVVEQQGSADAPRVAVELLGEGAERGAHEFVPLVRAALGVDVELAPFYGQVTGSGPLSLLARRFVGLKPPRIPTVFETLVSGIACQQLSLVVGMHLLARLAAAYGLSLGGNHAFPRPEDLLGAAPQDLRDLGFSLRKSRTILWLAGEVVAGRIDLEGLREADTQEAIRYLVALPGIGRWTAHYVALRGLGRLEMFPIDDVGAQNKLQRLLELEGRPNAERTSDIVAAWHPYEGLLYFHLLLDSLERDGVVSGG